MRTIIKAAMCSALLAGLVWSQSVVAQEEQAPAEQPQQKETPPKPKPKPVAPYSEDDVQRVNGPYAMGYTQIIRPAGSSTNYPDKVLGYFQEGKLEPGEKVYANYWGLYQFFLGGNIQKPEETVCLHHNIHFFLGPKKSAKRSRPKPKIIDVDKLTDEQFLPAQGKSCGNPKKARAVISFKLFNYHQPVLVRNTLILAKAGFFDDREMFYWDRNPGILAIGLTNTQYDPFVYPPEPRFARSMPRFAGDYLGAVVENPAGVALTKQIVPLRVAFANADQFTQTSKNPAVAAHEVPVAIGQMYAPYPNSVKSFSKIAGARATLEVDCVAVDVPVVSRFDAARNVCPLTAVDDQSGN